MQAQLLLTYNNNNVYKRQYIREVCLTLGVTRRIRMTSCCRKMWWRVHDQSFNGKQSNTALVSGKQISKSRHNDCIFTTTTIIITNRANRKTIANLLDKLSQQPQTHMHTFISIMSVATQHNHFLFVRKLISIISAYNIASPLRNGY